MKIVAKIVLRVLLLCVIQSAFSLDLTKINLEYRYDVNAEIQFNHRVVEQGETLLIYFEILADTSRHWSLDLLLQKGYAAQNHDTLTSVAIDTIRKEQRSLMSSIQQPKPTEADLLLFVYSDEVVGTMMVFEVYVGSGVTYPSFFPIDQFGFPIIAPYVKSSELSFGGTKRNEGLLAFEYANQFEAADPAMGQMKPLAPTLDIDTSFYFTDTANQD